MKNYLSSFISAGMSASLLLAGCTLTGGDSESQENWVDLFANDSFALWQEHDGDPVDMANWSLQDGVVHFKETTKESQAIATHATYLDFELKFEWKISEAGNSGVKYRISPKNSRLGLEYQLLDDVKHPDNQIDSHLAGSLYDIVPASKDKPLHPVGQWNQARIVAKGNQIQHWLNGAKILEVEHGSAEWITAFQNSKYSKREGFGSWEGPILLQDHHDEFWIRNMQIREL